MNTTDVRLTFCFAFPVPSCNPSHNATLGPVSVLSCHHYSIVPKFCPYWLALFNFSVNQNSLFASCLYWQPLSIINLEVAHLLCRWLGGLMSMPCTISRANHLASRGQLEQICHPFLPLFCFLPDNVCMHTHTHTHLSLHSQVQIQFFFQKGLPK